MQPRDDWVFNLNPSEESTANALIALIKYFEWDQAAVTLTPTRLNREIIEIVQENIEITVKAHLEESDSYVNVERSISRVIKPQGTPIHLFLASASATEEALIAAEQLHIGDRGSAFILASSSAWYPISSEIRLHREGPIIVVPAGTNQSTSMEAYWLDSLFQLLQFVGEQFDGKSPTFLSGPALRDLAIEFFDASHFRKANFDIANIQNGQRIRLGSIEANLVRIDGIIKWPGGSQEIPKITQAVIPTSMERDTYNEGAPDYQDTDMFGADLAYKHINQDRSILPNHILSRLDLTLGASYFNYDFAKSQMTKISQQDLGYVNFSPPSSSVSMGILGIWAEMGYEVPMIGSSNTVDELGSNELFPLYSRIIVGGSNNSIVFVKIFQRSNWRKCNIIYGDEPFGRGIYEDLVEQFGNEGIEITNPENLRGIPFSVTKDTIEDYDEHLKFIRDSDTYILILISFGHFPMVITEYLYDIGVRRGDFQLVATEWLTEDYFVASEDYDVQKIEQLLYGALQFFPASFVGEMGEYVLSEFQQEQGNDPGAFAWYYYDSPLGAALNFQRMLSYGQEYENPHRFRNVYRENRYTGWTGLIMHEQESNNRLPSSYDIQNLQYVNDTWFLTNVGTYSPYSKTLFSFYNDILWADGSNTLPADVLTISSSCPFPEDDIESFPPGRIIAFSVLSFIILCSVLVALFSWRRWFSYKIDRLETRQPVSLYDLLVWVGIVIDVFQLLSLGPDFEDLSEEGDQAATYISLKMAKIIDLKDGVYYQFLLGFLLGVIAWILGLIVILTKIDLIWARFYAWRFTGEIIEFVLPVIGNFLFIPILSVLFDIFVWDEAFANGEPKLTDSFLAQDCFVSCWDQPHSGYVSFTCIILVIYLPLSIVTRPIWQEYQVDIHIKSQPYFLLLKTIFQIVLVGLYKTVYRVDEIIHGVIFIFLLGAYIVFNVWIHTINHDRSRLWHLISLIGVFWTAIWAIMNQAVQIPIVFKIMLFFGIGILVVIGLIIQNKKYPSLLYRTGEKNQDILFQFGFEFRTKVLPSEIAQQSRIRYQRRESITRRSAVYSLQDFGSLNSMSIESAEYSAAESSIRQNEPEEEMAPPNLLPYGNKIHTPSFAPFDVEAFMQTTDRPMNSEASDYDESMSDVSY